MYDVIVVGARVAGAPTAMLLARKGYRVLLVDKSTFPSDMLSSTLLIWPPGIALLQHWGLLEPLQATQCPPLTRYRASLGAPFDPPGPQDRWGPHAAGREQHVVCPPAHGLGYAPGRCRRRGGVTLYEGFTVDQILLDGERVVGMRGQTQAGAPVTEQATLVIGADGVHSLVARTVSAAEYQTHDPIVLTYYAYWRDVALADGVHVEFCPQDWCAAYAWPTHHGHLLLGTNWAAPSRRCLPGGGVHPVQHGVAHGVCRRHAERRSQLYAHPGAVCAVARRAVSLRRDPGVALGWGLGTEFTGNRLAPAGRWWGMPGAVMNLRRPTASRTPSAKRNS